MNGELSIGTYFPPRNGSQEPEPADVAVMMVTMLRPSIQNAIQSIYQQTFRGSIQILIGVDVLGGPDQALKRIIADRPEHVSFLVVNLPYPTALTKGGVHAPKDGGALRAILAFIANSRYLAILDDDNTWLPVHLEMTLRAASGKAWAYTQRLLVDEVTDLDLGIDIWHSVGADQGLLSAMGGFVDPNCLLIDKVRMARSMGAYADTFNSQPGLNSDRLVFRALRDQPHSRIGEPTVRYKIRRRNSLWPFIARERPDQAAKVLTSSEIAHYAAIR